jgi:hypothetical protein
LSSNPPSRFIAALVLAALGGCSLNQAYRDQLRYASVDRGAEVYAISNTDSLQSALKRNEQEIALYREHKWASDGIALPQTFKVVNTALKKHIANLLTQAQSVKAKCSVPKEGEDAQKVQQIIDDLNSYERMRDALDDSFTSEAKNKDDHAIMRVRLAMHELQGNVYVSDVWLQAADKTCKQHSGGSASSGATAAAETSIVLAQMTPPPVRAVPGAKMLPPTENQIAAQLAGGSSASYLAAIWSTLLNGNAMAVETDFDANGKPKKEVRQPDANLVRALSSSAAIFQMRDLLTEPAFPPMLPTSRQVTLGCLPPPDSAAFEAAANLSAAVKKDDKDQSIDGEFGVQVAKLFEESERTLFLQYALFRLCEMSVNAPAGFRNVYPVVVHDIVRRTAEMTELANKEAEQRRAEEEKSKQEKEKTKQVQSKEAALRLEESLVAANKELVEKQAKLEYQKMYSACISNVLGTKPGDVANAKTECDKLPK